MTAKSTVRMAKPNQLPGVGDIRLLNFFLALALWLATGAWLALIYNLALPASTKHVIEKHPSSVADFWVVLSKNAQPFVGLGVFLCLIFGWILVRYLRGSGLKSGWVLPLISVLLNLGAAAGVLYLLAPVLIK